ncbi:T9SS type A sorting domain-containing protein [Flavobacterium wongokense]|uniref:T9SS type A sorting domain-containing protein n=1 Tax=Flavobacterium wongokense TaxID=2910674 RepID=UPI001F367AEB|nr:T9SS type A sorting domain-containing protein [Flavobacterium sp. WG47]MCF6131693.1 T9SS type A sorting domain-containing protein [Flavobacterium sp. WG47]
MTTKNYSIKLIAVMAFLITAFTSNAQCSFDPTITGNRLVCHDTDVVTLSTQTYDSYQWYRREWYWDTPNNPNPWVAVSGATNQTFTTNGASDFLFEFKVAVTLSGCTEDSPLELIDGFAYGLPYMISTFEDGTYEQIDFAEFNICEGATVRLENGFTVYGEHTWFKCVPSTIPAEPTDPCIINGAHGLTYNATSDGTYGFYACTTYCPDLCEFLGDFNFIKLNFGNFSFCALGTEDPQNQLNVSVYPNPTAQFLNIGRLPGTNKGDFTIADMNGKTVKQLHNFSTETPIDVSDLASGTYLLVLKSEGKTFRNKFIKK